MFFIFRYNSHIRVTAINIIIILSCLISAMYKLYTCIFKIWKQVRRRRIGHSDCTPHVTGCNKYSRYLDVNYGNERNNYSSYNSNTVAEAEQLGYISNTCTLLKQSDTIKTQSRSRLQIQPKLRSNIAMMEIKHQFGSQLNFPSGFCLNMDGHIVVTDTNNRCIKVFNKNGRLLKHISNGEDAQSWYPYKVVQMSADHYVMCEENMGLTRLCFFNEQGDFTYSPMGIGLLGKVVGMAINRLGEIIIIEELRCCLYCFTKDAICEGMVCCTSIVQKPSDLAIHNEEYFICDTKGNCIVVLNERGHLLRVIRDENIIKKPIAIDVSCNGHLLIASRNENCLCLSIFSTEGIFINANKYPHTPLSSSFSLKISKDHCLVIVDKKNHRIFECKTYSHTHINFILRGMRELNGGRPLLTNII